MTKQVVIWAVAGLLFVVGGFLVAILGDTSNVPPSGISSLPQILFTMLAASLWFLGIGSLRIAYCALPRGKDRSASKG